MLAEFLSVASLAFVVAALGTWLGRQIARRQHWLPQPRNDRWHRQPVPKIGGVAIVGAFLAVSLAWGLIGAVGWGVFLPLIAMFVLGFLDDVLDIRARTKLFIQILLAVTLLGQGFSLPLTGIAPLDVLVTLLWLVGLANAFNLLDNMNGLCAGCTIIVALSRGAVFLLNGESVEFMLCLALAGAAGGFLLFNFPRASVFMGDSGSLFIGFALATFALLGNQSFTKTYVDALVFPLLLMFLPILDTSFVTVVRWLSGRRISQGGTDHLSHSLVAGGMSECTAVLLLWAIAALAGTVSLVGNLLGSARIITLALVLLAAFAALCVLLGRYQLVLRAGRASLQPWLSARPAFVVLMFFDALLVTLAYYNAAMIVGATTRSGSSPFFLITFVAYVVLKIILLAVFGVYVKKEFLFGPSGGARFVLASGVGTLIAGAYTFAVTPPTIRPGAILFFVEFVLFAVLGLCFRYYLLVLQRLEQQLASALLANGAGQPADTASVRVRVVTEAMAGNRRLE